VVTNGKAAEKILEFFVPEVTGFLLPHISGLFFLIF
jgi:hypothetical protein